MVRNYTNKLILHKTVCSECMRQRKKYVPSFSWYVRACSKERPCSDNLVEGPVLSMEDIHSEDKLAGHLPARKYVFAYTIPLFSEEVVCRAHDALFAKEQENTNLKPAKESFGLYKFYGTDETVGIDVSKSGKAYSTFRSSDMKRKMDGIDHKVMDDRSMYW